MQEESKDSLNHNQDDGFNWVLAVIVGFFIWLLYTDNRKKGQEIQQLKKTNQDMRSELLKINEIVSQADDLTKEAKIRIQNLIENSKPMDEKVRSELAQAFMLIQAKLTSKALLAMGKIIENSLKAIFNSDHEFKTKYKAGRFVDLLNHAAEKGVLEKDEYHFANGIRELRNREAHQLDVKHDSSWEVSSVILATSIIIKLEDKKPRGLSGLSHLNQ